MEPDEQAVTPWLLADESASLDPGAGGVTLVDGQTFCLSDRAGDVDPGLPHGLFFADLRFLSLARLTVRGAALEPLAVDNAEGHSATFVLRSRQPMTPSGSRLVVVRRRTLGDVMTEEIELRSFGSVPQPVVVRLHLDTDFAELFAVKEGRQGAPGGRVAEAGDGALVLRWESGRVSRTAMIDCPGATVTATGATWRVEVPSDGTATCRWAVRADLDGRSAGPRTRDADHSGSASRHAAWLSAAPRLRTDHTPLSLAFDKAVSDLGGLRLFDPAGRRGPVVAAGAPWFMTLFGRDALITAYMALPVDPTLAIGVLDALAELQGTRTATAEEGSEEEPGRILHEVRFTRASSFRLEDGEAYYGSVDASPLFVVLLGELSRWGLPEADLTRLLPAADRALGWVEARRRASGTPYLYHSRTSAGGLANQAWKDSWDGVRYHDGRVAHPPLAMCEVQGYVYAAFVARAGIAERLGDPVTAARMYALADELQAAFAADFWVRHHARPAVALDGDGGQVDSLASNIGHCLWSGIVPAEQVAATAAALTSAPMWTGWGLRTLAGDEPAYDPTSYHCGSVWPHDNALCAAGLMRAGRVDDAHRIMLGLLAAATTWGGRMPELFCGFGRDDIGTPVPYPTSCSPQAWSAASPLLFTRLMLGLEPDLPNGVIAVCSRLPAGIGEVSLDRVRLLTGDTVAIAAAPGAIDMTRLAGGSQAGIRVVDRTGRSDS